MRKEIIMTYYLGVDVGGTKIAYGLFDSEGNLLEKEKTPSSDRKSAEEFFGEIADKINLYTEKAHSLGGSLESAGIGIPGFVEFETGKLSKIASLPELSGFSAAEYIRDCVSDKNIRIVLDNDGHCGALAEYKHGAGRGHKNMIYALVSTGISTSAIFDGKLMRGSNGAAGESGHMVSGVSDEIGHDCMCGNTGCFNSLASGKAILNYVRAWIEDGEKTVLTDLAGNPESITTSHLCTAFDMGDELAIRAINQMAHYLAIWIFDVYMLLNIDCIVFSGGLMAMGDRLKKKMREEFDRFHTNGFPVYFYDTQLGEDSCLIGAMELGREVQ